MAYDENDPYGYGSVDPADAAEYPQRQQVALGPMPLAQPRGSIYDEQPEAPPQAPLPPPVTSSGALAEPLPAPAAPPPPAAPTPRGMGELKARGESTAPAVSSDLPQLPEGWKRLDIVPPEVESPKGMGYATELGHGIARSAHGLMSDIASAATTGVEKVADWTGSEFLKHFTESERAAQKESDARVEKEYGPSVATLADAIEDPSKFGHYMTGKLGEAMPWMVGYATAGVKAMVLAGMAVGGNKAYEESGGDPAATVTGTVVGGAIAGAPMPFLHGAAGRTLTENVTRGLFGLPVVGVAATAAEPIPKAVGEADKSHGLAAAIVDAVDKYQLPTKAEFAEAAAGMAPAGLIAGLMGYHASRGLTRQRAAEAEAVKKAREQAIDGLAATPPGGQQQQAGEGGEGVGGEVAPRVVPPTTAARPTHIIGYDENGAPIADPNIPVNAQGPPGALAESTTGSHLNDPAVGAAVDAAVNTPPASAADAAARQIMQGADPRQVLAEQTRQGMGPSPVAGGPAMGLADPTVAAARAGPPPPAAPPPGFTAPIDRAAIERGATIAQARAQAEEGAPPPTPPAEAPGIPRAPGAGRGVPVEEPPITGYQPGRTGIAPEPPPSGRPVPLAQQTDVSPGWRMGPDGKLYRAETPNLENVSGWQIDANGNLQRVENAPTSEPTAGPLFERTAQPIAPQVGEPITGRMMRSTTGEMVPRYPLGPEGQGTLPITTLQTPIRMSRREPPGAGTTTPERPPGYLPGGPGAESRGGRPRGEAAPEVRTEIDHEDAGKYVSKDQADRVIGVGETPDVAKRLGEEFLAREAARGETAPAAPTEAAAPPPAAPVVEPTPAPAPRRGGKTAQAIADKEAAAKARKTAGTTVVEPTPSPAPTAKTGGAGREGTTRPATDVGVKETAPGKFRVTVDGKELGSTYMSREKADAVATRAGSLASDTKLTGPALVAKAASIVRGTAKLAESYRKTTAEIAARVAKEGTPPVAEPEKKPTPVVGLIKRPDRFEPTKPGEAATKGRTLSPEERAKVAAEYQAAEAAKQQASRRTADAIAAREAARRSEIAEDIGGAAEPPASAAKAARGMEDIGTVSEAEAAREPTKRESKTVSRGGKDSTLLYERGAASTTDQRIHGSRLLQDVLEGHIDPKTGEPITPAGASERYGSQAPGAGQRRRENRFVDYLNHRIEMAEDPKHLDALILRAKDLEGRKQTAVVKKQFAEVTRDYNRLAVERDRLEDVKAIRDELASTKPKTGWGSGETLAQRIARRKAERDGGVAGMAPDVIEFPDAAARSAEHRIRRDAIAAEGVNAALEERIRVMHANKEVHNLGDFLDDLIDSPAAKAFTPHFVKLAEIYKGMIDTRSIPVRTFVKELYPGSGLTSAGYYDSNYDSIHIRTRPHGVYSRAQVLMHEATHVVSLKYLNDIGRRLLRGGGEARDPRRYVTLREEQVYRSMDALGDELQRVLQYGRNISQAERSSGEYAYQSKNNIELITEGISNPYLQSLMARTKASSTLIKELRKWGMLPDNVRPTMWDAFKDTMRQMFGLKPGERSVLELALRPLTETIEVGAAYRGGRGPGRGAVEGIAGAPPELPARITDAQPTPEARELARDVGDRVRAMDGGTGGSAGSPKGTDTIYAKVMDHVTEKMPNEAAVHRAVADFIAPGVTTLELTRYPTNKEALPHGERIALAQGKAQRVFTDILAERGDHVQDMIHRLRNASPALIGDSQRNSLMNRASLAEAFISNEHMTAEQANPHLKGDKLGYPASATEPATGVYALKNEFNALSQHDKDLYRDIMKFHQDTHWDERHASYAAAVDMALGNEFVPERTTPQSYQDRWDAMMPDARAKSVTEGQDVNVRNFYTNSLNEQRAELARIGRSKTKLNEVLGRGADNSPLAQMMADKWEHSKPMVRLIARLQREGWREGDFFPQRRKGDWFVKWGNEEIPQGERGAYGMAMFERNSEAQAWLDEFKSRPENAGIDTSQVLLKSTTGSGLPKDMLLDPAIQRFTQELIHRGLTPETPAFNNARDALVGMFMQNATQSQAARLAPKRRGIQGSSNDHAQILQNELVTHASRMGWYTTAAETNRLFGDAEKYLTQLRKVRGPSTPAELAESARLLAEAEKKFAANDPSMSAEEIADFRQQHAWRIEPPSGQMQNRAVQVLEELQKRRAPIDGDSSPKWTGTAAKWFTTGTFVHDLMRPAHLAVQTFDAHMNSVASLGGEFGFAKASGELFRTLVNLGPKGLAQGARNAFAAAHGAMKQSDWHMSKTYEKWMVENLKMKPEEAHALMDKANDYGLIDYSTVREVQRMAGKGAFGFVGEGKASSYLHNFMNLFAAGEHAVDALNRTVILAAGYNLARRAGMDVASAIDKSIFHATRAMPVNAMWNKPRIATERGMFKSPLIAAPMQFKLYGMHMYSWMGSLVKQAISRPEERAVAIKTLAAIFATHSLLVGALANMFGLPVNIATGVYDFFTGKPGPHDYEIDSRRAIADRWGPTIATFLSRGLIGLAGADLHRSLKITNMVDVPQIKTFDRAGVTDALASVAFGASGQLSEDIIDGAHQLYNGNYNQGLSKILPRTIGDMWKAYLLKNQGLLDSHGHQIMKPEQFSTGAALLQAAGFNPMEVADPRAKRQAIAQTIHEVGADRQNALDRYVNHNDTSGIWAYNRTAQQEHLPIITGQNMKEAQQRQRQRLRDPTVFGVTVPRNELAAARAAANF